MPSRPFRAQAAAPGLALAVLLSGGARGDPVEIARGAYPAQIMERAEAYLRIRDFSAARSFYEAAARQGVAAAATALGTTYDPAQISRMGGGIAGDPALAEKWYQSGADLGDPDAPALLQSIRDRRAQPDAPPPAPDSTDRFLRTLGVDRPSQEDRKRVEELQKIPHLGRRAP